MNYTKIIHKESIKSRLLIAEAVNIALQKPTLNIQTEFDYVLPLCRNKPNREVTDDAVTAPSDGNRQPDNVDGGNVADGARGEGQERTRRLRPLPHRV